MEGLSERFIHTRLKIPVNSHRLPDDARKRILCAIMPIKLSLAWLLRIKVLNG